jgi:hypothetical protein
MSPLQLLLGAGFLGGIAAAGRAFHATVQDALRTDGFRAYHAGAPIRVRWPRAMRAGWLAAEAAERARIGFRPRFAQDEELVQEAMRALQREGLI